MFWTGDPGLTEAGKSISFNQHIMGGTLASTMAGEFSFSLALALSLFFLGTFAEALQTRRRLWFPALLLAMTVTSHLMVGVFAIVAGIVIWLFHHPWRNLGRHRGDRRVATLITAVWALPLLATLGFATDMRYSPIGECASGTQCNLADSITSTISSPSNLFDPQGWLPYRWGAYILIGILIVVAIALAAARRRLLTIALLSGLMFRFWSSIGTKVWNLRALPFWYLSIFLLMGVALAELVWLAAWAAREYTAAPRANRRRRQLVEAPAFVGSQQLLVRRVADGRPRRRPGRGAAPTSAVVEHPVHRPRPRQRRSPGPARRGRVVQVNDDKGFLPYWVKWNYSGYQNVRDELRSDGTVKYALAKAYPEYRRLMNTMAKLPPGRALWEGGSAVDKYGTPLALMLLPYWTDGRIQSMEGVYFEASSTTPYHFETVAALVQAANASNPERGIPYRTNADFTIGVKYLQTLGVNYFITSEDATKAQADADSRLQLVASTPDRDGAAPKGWNVYRVKNSPLVQPLSYQPVVATGVVGQRLGAGRRRRLVLVPRPARQAGGGRRTRELAAGTGFGCAAPAPPHAARRARVARPDDRRLRLLRRRPHRCPRAREGVVLPELAGRRCRRTVARHAELHGRRPHEPPRDPALRHDGRRMARTVPDPRRLRRAGAPLLLAQRGRGWVDRARRSAGPAPQPAPDGDAVEPAPDPAPDPAADAAGPTESGDRTAEYAGDAGPAQG